MRAMKAPVSSLAIGMLLVALAGWPAAEAFAGPDRGRGSARAHAEPGLSLDQAVARVERQYKARAVRAERDRRDGRTVYRIRLLGADGRVFDVTVDAASGDVE